MGRVTINDKMQVVDVDTGKVLGQSVNGHFSLNSDFAQEKTLEQLGVQLPVYDEKEDMGYVKTQDEIEERDELLKENGELNNSEEQKVTTPVKEEQNKQEQKETIQQTQGPTSFKKEKTKYQISNDTFFVVKFGLLQREDGRFVPIAENDVYKYTGAESHWVKFRMWNYGEQLKWKSQCTEFNNTTKMQYLNNDKLNQKKIKNLLLDWSFGVYEDRLKLLHCDGKLSDESYKILRGMYPSIINTIVDLMNYVLESNQ